jgi:hypothetical protein
MVRKRRNESRNSPTANPMTINSHAFIVAGGKMRAMVEGFDMASSATTGGR